MIKILIATFVLFEFIAIISSVKIDATKEKRNVDKQKMNDFMRNVYKMGDISDLVKKGVIIKNRVEPIGPTGKHGAPQAIIIRPSPITGRSGPAQSVFDAQSDVKDATPGKCDPKPECISNPLTIDIKPNQLAFPPCINIHRCDGCCPANEKCVAIKSDEIKMQKVGIITFDAASQPSYEDKMVTVSNHTDCECQCQWESDADCQKVNPNFVKSSYECGCECPEELPCDSLHEFDKESCSCKCRKDKFLRLEQTCRIKSFEWSDLKCSCGVSRFSMNHREIQLQKITKN